MLKPKVLGNSANSLFSSVLFPDPEGPHRTRGRGPGAVIFLLVKDAAALLLLLLLLSARFTMNRKLIIAWPFIRTEQHQQHKWGPKKLV